jgi:uncharacterized RDD family membrane protein YckC
LLTTAVVMAAGMLLQILWPGRNEVDPLRRHAEFVFLVGVLFAYFAWCWGRSGQTLAMQTWRVRLDTAAGGRAGVRALVIRFVVGFVAWAPLVPLIVWGRHHASPQLWTLAAAAWTALPYLWSALDRDRQFLHDRLAGTRLVELPKNTTA